MSTYVPIQAITLSAAAADVTFTGIPQTFTDLVLVVGRLKSTTSSPYLCFQFNSNTSTDYSVTHIEGTGTSAVSSRSSNQNQITTGNSVGLGTTADAMVITHFMNYSNTTTNKTAMSRVSVIGGSFPGTGAAVGLWRQTSAITSIRVFNNAGNLPADCTLTLYGIGSGSPKAFGGDRVVTDGTYWYHAFLSSGRFEPVQNLSCDVFMVSGGGGGGGTAAAGAVFGAGGGAGGYKYLSAQSLSPQTYTVAIGAGGAFTDTGTATTFTSITGPSAGGGGGSDAVNGKNGGSGGGAASAGGTRGTGVTGEGFNGGTGQGTAGVTAIAGGGGGGGGAVGANASSTSVAGAGGIGFTSSNINAMASATSLGVLSGGNYYFAGGGGGTFSDAGGTAGAGGTGGGGGGSPTLGTNGTAGTANTGGGGGGGRGSGGNGKGGSGGSGIVIVRYSV